MISTPISDLTNKYNMINAAKSDNRNTNKVTLNYSKLDTVTVGELKQAITKTINNYLNYPDTMISDNDKNYLNTIIKQNTGSIEVSIDYDKIEDINIKFSIKGQVQDVLSKRANAIYNDIMMCNNRL